MYNYFRLGYYVASLMRHTHWKHQRLLNYQNERIREIVKYAYDNVQFYHEKFQQLGTKPEAFRTVDDLSKIPVIRRDELQKNSEKLISREFDPNKLKVASTSGSTGRPFFTYLTMREDEFRKAKLLRPHIVCGQKIRDKWVVIGPPQHSGNVNGLQRFLGVYAPVFVSVFDPPSKQLAAIEKIKPDVLDGYSSSLFLLASEIKHKRINAIEPRFTMGGAELIDESSRKLIEDMFHAPYYDQYASEEFQMIAWQCPEGQYHIDADSLVMQFVDENGEEVTPGERGEIVCTSLFNYAMPIMRYALRDVGALSEKVECGCGRTFPVMKLIEGRKESIVLLPGGRSLSPLAIGDCMCAFKYFSNIYQYRFIQRGIDSFKILIEKRDGSIQDKVLESELVRHIRKTLRLGESEAALEVEFVDKIPIDKTGKIRKVVSELKNDELDN